MNMENKQISNNASPLINRKSKISILPKFLRKILRMYYDHLMA